MVGKLLGYYNYTVVLTYIGMMIGLQGIIAAMNGDTNAGLICLMLAGVCDMFDGAIASTKKRNADEKCFGIQIDSLSDLICFGVLPGIILCRQTGNHIIVHMIVTLFVLCTLIRLSYFNVDEQNRQRVTEGRREFYYGLPVTTIAVSLPLFFAIADQFGTSRSIVGMMTLITSGILFLVPFKLRKPEKLGKIVLGVCGAVEFCFLLVGMS